MSKCGRPKRSVVTDRRYNPQLPQDIPRVMEIAKKFGLEFLGKD
jgi:hypothetical protein